MTIMGFRQIIFLSQILSTVSFIPYIKHHKSRHLITPSIPKVSSIIVAKSSILDTLQSLFQNPDKPSNRGKQQQIENAKINLLLECRRQSTMKDQRDRTKIEDLIKELESLSPMEGTAQSGNLQREWKMEWTTEKEINLFLDWKISNNVYQTIADKELINGIVFKNGGGLFVSGLLSIPDDYDLFQGKRTNFKFSTATLDLGKWGSFTIPPVGEGWFDTIYLDYDLRVDINSRNDILVCTCS